MRLVEKLYTLIKPLLLIYLFLLPFVHLTTPRETAFVSLFIIFAVKLVHKGLEINFRDHTVQAVSLLFAVALLTSLISPYPYESLNFIRKNLLYQGLVFFVIVNEYKSFEDLKPLFYTLFASYALLTVLVLVYNKPSVLLNWIEHTNKKYAEGYSLHGTFYIPLMAGFLYSTRINARLRWPMIFALFVEFALCVLDNHRGQTAAIAFSLVAVTMLTRRLKILFIGLIACLVLGIALLSVKPDMFSRYKTLISPATYLTNEYHGWNGRFAIWSGVMDMVRERPIAGYGYGWKKMATVVRDRGFLERWDKKGGTYDFFSTHHYGSTTAHNLIMQILFEGGCLGLTAFLIFWATIFLKLLPLPARGRGDGAAFLRYGATGILLSYIIVNIAWSLWEEVAGIHVMLFAAICVVLYEQMQGPHFLFSKRK